MKFNGKQILDYFKGETRGAKAKRHVVYSILIQGVSILIGLLYVPLLLEYLTQEKYGIWITLTTILGWFSFFDIGLGNGLRNKLAEVLATNDFKKGKILVSTTYAMLIAIFSLVLLLFHISNIFYLNWNTILNTRSIESNELFFLTSIVFTFFIIRFIVQIISVIFLADQKPSVTKLITTSGNVLAFVVVFILTKTEQSGNLVLLGTIISAIPVLIFIIVTIIAFNTSYKDLKPSFNSVDFKIGKGILQLGTSFFFLQITYIIVFTTANIFITQFYGPEEVTVYNIAYKYFHIPIMVFSLFMMPVWSAVTDAYTKADFNWLKKALKYANILSVLFSGGVVIMLFVSTWIYKIWVGEEVQIPVNLSIALAVFTVIELYITPYSYFINGIGKLKLTVLFTTIQILIYIILVYTFKNIFGNSIGIVLAILGPLVLVGSIQVIQVHKLLRKTALGVWNK